MRIAFLLNDFDMGGMVSWTYRLATTWQAGHELHFLCTHVERVAPKFFDVGRPSYLGRDWRRVKRYLADHRIEVVQFGQLRVYADCAFAAGVPVVVERADGPRRPAVLPKRDLDAVIASVAVTLPELRRHVDANRLHLIQNGVDVDAAASRVADRLDAGPADVVIGVVARFGRVKNIELLLDAVRRLVLRYASIRLVIVGDNSNMPGSDDYRALLAPRARGLEPWVRFVGHTDEPERLIAGFDIGACTSRSEGIPNAVLEMMAAGKPIIATAVGGIPELVRHEQDGLLIADNDLDALVCALERLITDPTLRARLGASGRERVAAEFDLATQAARYEALFERLLAEARARPAVVRAARRIRGECGLLAHALRQRRATIAARPCALTAPAAPAPIPSPVEAHAE